MPVDPDYALTSYIKTIPTLPSPPAPKPGVAQPVPGGDSVAPEILFEYRGWGIYTPHTIFDYSGREGSCLTHIGCDCDFSNWHMSVYIWSDYTPEGNARFSCPECGEVLDIEAYTMFCKVYNLLNKQ